MARSLHELPTCWIRTQSVRVCYPKPPRVCAP